MRVKKRQKTSRLRGSRTAGYGFRQKHKGHGNSGGYGYSGSGKRGDQKKQMILMEAKAKGFKTYFGKQGMTSAASARKINNVMNLSEVAERFVGESKIELKKYKILGHGEGFKAEITVGSASKTAIAKMEKAGGKIILPVKKERKIVEKKTLEKKSSSENDIK